MRLEWPPARRALRRLNSRPAARTSAIAVPARVTRMAIANGVQPKGAAKSNGMSPRAKSPSAPEPMAPADRDRNVASATNAPSAMTASAAHGAVSPMLNEDCDAARAGRAETSQKTAVPTRTRSSTSAAQRAAMMPGSTDGEALTVVPIGPGCTPVGSKRNAY